jgi:membrane protease YdiL (CAAX protease family)
LEDVQRPDVIQPPATSRQSAAARQSAAPRRWSALIRVPAVSWPLVEVAAMSLLLFSYIWGWGGAFEGSFTLCVILYFAIGFVTHLRAGEDPADLGIRIDNIGPAGRDALLATAAIFLLLAGAGAVLGSLDFPPLALWPRTLGDGVVWGLMQQYGLLCVYYRRFNELLPRPRGAPLLAASAIFALLHLPNPFLTLATFGAGALSCWLYRRSQNLLVLGAMHGFVSFLIVHTLYDAITAGMRVGPGFYHFVAGR